MTVAPASGHNLTDPVVTSRQKTAKEYVSLRASLASFTPLRCLFAHDSGMRFSKKKPSTLLL